MKTQVPLSQLTSFKQEGYCSKLWVADSEEDCREFIREHSTFFVLGKGSNTVISPNLKTPILQIGPHFSKPVINGNSIDVHAGVTVHQLLKLCVDHDLSGLEFCAGVPASVGGMVVMNFGCWGQEIAQVVEAVQIMNKKGHVSWISNAACDYEYRGSWFQTNPVIVLKARFKLRKGTGKEIQKQIDQNILTRLEKQPLRSRTFGSIFKNSNDQQAGKVLEECGLKGKRFGSVECSDKHANFLVNTGDATYDDLKQALTKIQKKVKDKTGSLLELEVKLWE